MKLNDVIISNHYNNIHYYIEMTRLSNLPNFNSYYLDLLSKEINNLFLNLNNINQFVESRNTNEINHKITMTKKELSYYDGTNGKPAYVAVNGIVYDVSLAPTWGGGTHFKLYSGKDLTPQFNSCHTIETLEELPKVGIIINSMDESHE